MKITSSYRLIIIVKMMLALAAVDLFGDEPGVGTPPAPSVSSDGTATDPKDYMQLEVKVGF